MISVAILSYNRASVFVRCIKSIVKGGGDLRIKVFDDCSSMNDFKIIREECDKHENVELIQNKANKGYRNNFIDAIKWLALEKQSDYLFLCESDMLLSDEWEEKAINAFNSSTESVALSMMLHREQCSIKHYNVLSPSRREGIEREYFLECSKQKEVGVLEGAEIKYVVSTVGTFMFRGSISNKILDVIDQLHSYEGYEDEWYSEMFFKLNNWNSRSIMVLDPGLALTIGPPGLHGNMMLENKRWAGSFLWRNRLTSELMHQALLLFIRLKNLAERLRWYK